MLRSEGQLVNHERIRRYWVAEGLTRPARTRKKQRIGPQRGQRLLATGPDRVWALDFQVEVTIDGRQIRFCNIVDEFTREALATAAARSLTADDTTILLDKVIAATGRRPAHLRMDNGLELTAAAMRDWCRFSEVATAFIEPGSPWQNGYCESFNGRFRDEFLATEQFDPLLKSPGLGRGPALRIQHRTTPRSTRRTYAHQIPTTVDHFPGTRLAGAPTGVRSVLLGGGPPGSAPVTRRDSYKRRQLRRPTSSMTGNHTRNAGQCTASSYRAPTGHRRR
ncbi:MAG: DDE-type integrase/transposase/recombinase [Pseudonocardiaceae bacterium]